MGSHERFLFFKKIGYLQWICAVSVSFFLVVLFQMFLAGSVMEKSENLLRERDIGSGDLTYLKEMAGLDFGKDTKFEPSKLLAKFQKEFKEGNGSRRGGRFGYRKPQLVVVFANLLVDPRQIMMVPIVAALHEIGYEIEVHSLEDGPAHSAWRTIGVTINIIRSTEKMFASSEALKKMYGIKHYLNSLPPMPRWGHMVYHAQLGFANSVLFGVRHVFKNVCGFPGCTIL